MQKKHHETKGKNKAAILQNKMNIKVMKTGTKRQINNKVHFTKD